jgi:hypothetical protein
MVKSISATNFNESLLPGVNKDKIKDESFSYIYFDNFFGNNDVENNLKNFRSSSW